jgi:hypothetical protein
MIPDVYFGCQCLARRSGGPPGRLLKTDSSGNIRDINVKKCGIGSARETVMHRFGKSSIWTAAGFVFVSGLLLLPTQSSAQYINIEGMIRGALQGGGFQPYNGGGGGGDGYVRRRANSGYTSRHVRSQPKEQESAPVVDKSKERDATQVESANNNVPSGRQNLAAPAPPPAAPAPDTTRQTSSARGSGDEPAFLPSR